MSKKKYEYVTGPDLKELPAHTIANANSLVFEPTIALNFNNYAEVIVTDVELIKFNDQSLHEAINNHDYDRIEQLIAQIKHVQKLVAKKHHHLYFDYRQMDNINIQPLTNQEVIELIQPTRFKNY